MPADCVGEMIEKYGISKKDAAELLRQVRESSPDPLKRIQYGKEATQRMIDSAKASEQRAQINAMAFASLRDTVERAKAAGTTTREGLAAPYVGTDRGFVGARDSAAAAKITVRNTVHGALVNELEAIDKNAPKIIGNERFGEELAKAMWEINGPEGYKYKPPSDYSFANLVKPVAALMDKYKEIGRDKLNQLGADIGKLGGHVMPQAHDPVKISRVGETGWIAKTLPLLDQARTFTPGADVMKAMKELYGNLSTGKWGAGMEMSANLSNALGASRELHFTGPDQFIAYNKAFGTKSIAQGVVEYIGKLAERGEIISRLGHDPERTMANAIDHYSKELTPNQMRLLTNEAKEVSGSSHIPGSAVFAHYASGLRNWTNIVRMGKSVTAQVPDVPIMANQMQASGMGLLQAHGALLENLAKSFSGGDRLKIARSLGVVADGGLAHTFQRLSAVDSVPGALSKAANLMMRFNGMGLWDEKWINAQGMLLSHWLADHAGKPWEFLPKELQTNLERYSINAKDWALMRTQGLQEAEGAKFVSPDNLPPEIAKKLQMYTTTEAHLGLPLPGARERAAIFGATQPGTWPGEVLRTLMQYKATSYTMISRVMPDAIRRGIPGSLVLATELTAFGYLSYAAREMMDGKTPPPVTGENAGKTYLQSFMRGGGAGILGDILLGGMVDTYKSLGDLALPAAFGPLAAIQKSVQKVINRKTDKGGMAEAEALHFMVSELPFVNFLALRQAINYGGLYHIQEKMNPGYLQRMEQRTKQSGQSYFGPSPTHELWSGR